MASVEIAVRSLPGAWRSSALSLLSLFCPLLRPLLWGWSELADPANIAGRTMARRLVAADHLREKIDVIVAFTGHLFANGMKLLKKMGTLIHQITH